MLRKLKWQIPREPLAARCNWCQGPVPGRGPAVEKHYLRPRGHWDRLLFSLGNWKCAAMGYEISGSGVMHVSCAVRTGKLIINCTEQHTHSTCTGNSIRVFTLPQRSRWELRSSGTLRSE